MNLLESGLRQTTRHQQMQTSQTTDFNSTAVGFSVRAKKQREDVRTRLRETAVGPTGYEVTNH